MADDMRPAASFSALPVAVEKKETVLTVSVDKTQTKSTVSAVDKKKETLQGYQIHVCLWALVSVVLVLGIAALSFGITMAWCLRQGKEMTAAEARSIVNMVAWCVAVQVINAAIALLFPTERDIAGYRAYMEEQHTED